MLIPDQRLGPYLVETNGKATLIIPVENGEKFDCLRMNVSRDQLALLVANGARILSDLLQREDVRFSTDFTEKSDGTQCQAIEEQQVLRDF